MRILHLMNETLVICRLTRTSGNKHVYATTTATIGHLQPVSAEKAQLFGGVYGKTFRVWVPPSAPVQEGDRLTDEDGNHYVIKKAGRTQHGFSGIDYRECLLEQVD